MTIPIYSLVWNLNSQSDRFFDSDETITFFWQSSIPPAGPIGSYGLNNTQAGTATGPAPATAPATSVPEPNSLSFWGLGILFFLPYQTIARAKQARS